MKRTFFLMVLLVGLTTFGCCAVSQPTREHPPVNTLMIDKSAFPGGWEASSDADMTCPPRAPWSGPSHLVECINQRFYSPAELRTGAVIDIYRFDSVQAATKEYQWRVDIHFDDFHSWSKPAGVTYASSMADRSRYRCSEIGCIYVVQYEVYVYYCGIMIYDASASAYANLLSVLFQAVDEKMALALSNEVE